MVEHRSAESEGLKFSPSWGLNFSLSHARDKTKKHLSPFLYRAQNLPTLLFHLLMDLQTKCSAVFFHNQANFVHDMQ